MAIHPLLLQLAAVRHWFHLHRVRQLTLVRLRASGTSENGELSLPSSMPDHGQLATLGSPVLGQPPNNCFATILAALDPSLELLTRSTGAGDRRLPGADETVWLLVDRLLFPG